MSLERFEAKFSVCPESGCWLWTGARHPRGYGRIRIRGRSVAAHRYSWELHRGPVRCGLHVLHRCDTPACVNPDHLFLGTHGDNMADMREKGRARAGGKVRWQKLTPGLHVEVRHRYQQGDVTQRELAEEFGVAQSMISYIVRGGWLARRAH